MRLDAAGWLGILHVHRIGNRLSLMQIADQEMVDGKCVAASAHAQQVQGRILQVELLNNSRWPGEVGAASGGKVFSVSGAAHRRNDHMKPVAAHQTYAVTQEKKVDPPPFHMQVGERTNGRKVGCRIAAQGDAIGYEARVGKVDAVVALNLDLAGKYLLQERLDIPVAIGPVQVYESNGQHETNEAGASQAERDPLTEDRLSGPRGVDRDRAHSKEVR